ncbi:MAG: hypothetical protein JSR58_05520 [Verrucomicrobia bacterium]|nr:hypothetical protein [Verrucomicrobiota bacterium]
MQKWLVLLSALWMVSCGSSSDTLGANLADQTINYQIEDNRYAVVVAEDGISTDEARDYALKRAAQVAQDNGYSYFSIDKESQVAMARSDELSSDQTMPRNLYYEMIQSDNFGREPVEPGNPPPTSLTQGYRIEFTCHKEKPSGKSFSVSDFNK